MDLKIWLRYQLSGTVYIAWFLIFYYSSNSYDLTEITAKIFSLDVLKIFAAGIPIGAIIHQFSVSLKNQVLGGWFGLKFFRDSMVDDSKLTDHIIRRLLNNQIKTKAGDFKFIIGENCKSANEVGSDIVNSKVQAIHEKLSSLNTFYYMRVDNGFFAPVLAFISYILVIASTYDDLPWMTSMIVVAILILALILKFRTKLKCITILKHIIRIIKNSKRAPIVIGYIFFLSFIVSTFYHVLVKITSGITSFIAITFVSVTFIVILFSAIYAVATYSIKQITSYIIITILLLMIMLLYHLSNRHEISKLNLSKYFYPNQQVSITQTNESSLFMNKTNQFIIKVSDDNPNLVYESKEVYEYQRDIPLGEIITGGESAIKPSTDLNDANYMVYLKNGKKYEVKRVNKHLLPSVFTLCLLYMLGLLSYVPIIYSERKRIWDYYVI